MSNGKDISLEIIKFFNEDTKNDEEVKDKSKEPKENKENKKNTNKKKTPQAKKPKVIDDVDTDTDNVIEILGLPSENENKFPETSGQKGNAENNTKKEKKIKHLQKKENSMPEQNINKNEGKEEVSSPKKNNKTENISEKTKDVKKEIEDVRKEIKTKKPIENREVPLKDIKKEIEDVPLIEIGKSPLFLGESENGGNVFIAEQNRYLNTIIVGSKGTCKTSKLLPSLLAQDLKRKDLGVTVITNGKDSSFSIYALAKKMGRSSKDIIFLSPLVNSSVDELLFSAEYNYDTINEECISYKSAIKTGKVVIIDLELMKHRDLGLRAAGKLLLQLQLDIQETDITQKKPHMLYIDDAHYYLQFLKTLTYCSQDYNLGIVLFIQSKNLLNILGTDYTPMIENNFRNVILLNTLNKCDTDGFKSVIDNKYLFANNRNINSLVYLLVDTAFKRKCGICNYEFIDKDLEESIIKMAKSTKVTLMRKKRKEALESLMKDRNIETIEEARETVLNNEKVKNRESSIKIFNNQSEDLEYCHDDYIYIRTMD